LNTLVVVRITARAGVSVNAAVKTIGVSGNATMAMPNSSSEKSSRFTEVNCLKWVRSP
jgi:hypothetical protein